MTRRFLVALSVGVIGLFAFALFEAPTASAQICGPAYTVQPQTVMEEQLEQRMRVTYKKVYEDREMVTQRPVLKTRYEKRNYTVSRPIVETSTVEERYTVLKPITTREWIDRSYDETTYVTETAEREEAYTTYRPVTETTYQAQNYIVQRPVTEIQYQTQQYTTYSPVTTYQTAVVDQGQYYAQPYYQPGDTRYGLRWLPPGYSTNMYGNTAYRSGGLGWVPYTSPGTTYARVEYKPNPVQVAVPQTQMVPQVQQQQVPVQVTRLESQVVQQSVPVSQTRMEAVQETRRVPYTVQRPVTRRVERKEPVDRTEWVEQEMVRPKTVTRTSYKLETVEREVPVQYYETESVTTTVKVERLVPTYEPYTVRRLVPRTVQSPVVLSYFDAYAAPSSRGQSNWIPSTSDVAPAASEEITYGAARPAYDEDGDSGELPEQQLKKIETQPVDGLDANSDSSTDVQDSNTSQNASPNEGLHLNSSSGENAA